MGERIAVTKSADFDKRFTCDECGYSCMARVHVDGGGVGSVPVYDDTVDLAVREAERTADRNLATDAGDALKLVRCPKCGKRSRKELVSLAAWTVIPSALFAGLAYWMFQLFTLLGIALSFVSAGILVLGYRTLSRAGANVKLES